MSSQPALDADQIAALFTRDGDYLAARWGRPVAPVIFGLADESLDIFRGALKAAYAHAGHPIVETDPEIGANLMMFFCREWDELAEIPDFDQLTGQPDLIARLKQQHADYYQISASIPMAASAPALSLCAWAARLPTPIPRNWPKRWPCARC